MAANSDMNSPIDSIMNDVLNVNQSCTPQDALSAQASDGRKRLPPKKNDAQSSVKISFQLPKSVAIRLKRFAEKVPTNLTDFGLVSVHFLGERTIQLTNREGATDTREVRHSSGESVYAAVTTADSEPSTVRSTATDERYVAEDADCGGRFAAPLGVSAASPPPSVDAAPSRCTLPSPSAAVSVALVTANGLKLRVRTAPITPSPTDSDSSGVQTDRATNGDHRSDEETRPRADANGVTMLACLDDDERFSVRPCDKADRMALVRAKRVRDADCDAALAEKRLRSVAEHHALGLNGSLNGHGGAKEREPQNGLLLRSSKPLNGVRCGVAPRTVQSISSAAASDSR